MKNTVLFFLLLAIPNFLAGQNQPTQQGTFVRMRMTDCPVEHGFMAKMSGETTVDSGMRCPEYVLVTDKVVYVISSRNADQLLPLAEITRFRLLKNEMLIRIDDASKESRFHIKAMMLRSEWERDQMIEDAQAAVRPRHQVDSITIKEKQ